MKKYIITLLAAALAMQAASAQDMYFAQTLGRNNYYGTARSLALGGAMTALGGDLGSITFNPAGSAVNDYSQITITPGMSFSAASASYDPYDSGAFGSPNRSNKNRAALPNLGLNFVMYPDDSSWLVASSMGLIINTTNSYLNSFSAGGANEATSFLGSLAAAADGVAYGNLPEKLRNPYEAYQLWDFGPEGSNRYIGSNQYIKEDGTNPFLPAAVNQTASFQTYGSKSDVIFNLGYNVLDRFYFGFNFGMPIVRFRQEELFVESASDPVRFPLDIEGEEKDAYYVSSTNDYNLNADGIGVFVAAGFIWLPTESLRVGASFRSPTIMNITEQWWYSDRSTFENAPSAYSGSETSDRLRQSYNLITPYSVNTGIAYTVPGLGLLSVDYELTDYSIMEYSDESDYYNLYNYWTQTNQTIKKFCGVQHSVRAGVEFKPIPSIALRAGYAFTSDPEKYYLDADGRIVNAARWQGVSQELKKGRYYSGNTHAVSAGLGYSSPGSFFADLGVRLTSYPVAYYAPYRCGAYQAYDKDGLALNVGEPYVKTERTLFDAVLTLGWRF